MTFVCTDETVCDNLNFIDHICLFLAITTYNIKYFKKILKFSWIYWFLVVVVNLSYYFPDYINDSYINDFLTH